MRKGLFLVGLWISVVATPTKLSAAAFLPALPNGVAAGDTTATSTVLWTHSTNVGNVTFDYSTNSNFANLTGSVVANVTDVLLPVKVALNDLTLGTHYYYRVTDAGGNSLAGSFRTPAQAGDSRGLRFGVSGDWRGELAPYPSLANAAGRDLEFFVALGDTIYADFRSPAVPVAQARSLAEFRAKHNEVYSARFGMNTFAELRSTTSIFAMIDDHEVINDFAGGAPPSSDPRVDNTGSFINETTLYRTALQAFHEYNPIRGVTYDTPNQLLTHGKPKLYRTQTYGSDAAIFLLDARSFRDAELTPVTNPFNTAEINAFNSRSFEIDPATGKPLPHRTMLSAPQLADLKADLLTAKTNGVVWKFVMVPEPIENLGFADAQDRFEGYAAERTDLLRFIKDNKINNVVFVTADIHGTVVNNLNFQLALGQPQIPIAAFEVVTGSVAYDKPFGPTIFDIAENIPIAGSDVLTLLLNNVGLTNRAEFDSLPRQERDDKFKTLLDTLLVAMGYDATGLSGSGINATLRQGGYVAVHTFGWTEFEIIPDSRVLTITTYGIAPYGAAEVNPSITNRTPEIVSQFSVTPILEPIVLSIELVENDLIVSWPAAAKGFILEQTDSLTSPAQWTSVTTVPSTPGDRIVVRLSESNRSTFYRLRRFP